MLWQTSSEGQGECSGDRAWACSRTRQETDALAVGNGWLDEGETKQCLE